MVKLLAVLLSPPIFLLVYDIFFTYLPEASRNYGGLSGEFLAYMVANNIFMIFFLAIFTNKAKSLSLTSVRAVHNRSLGMTSYIVLTAIAVFSLLFLVFHVFGSYSVLLLIESNQYFYSESRRGVSWVYFILNACVFVVLYDIYLSGFKKQKVLVFFVLVLLNSAAGSRGNVISYMLIFVLIYGVIWRGKYIGWVGLVIALFIVGTFAYNTMMRSGSEGLQEYLNSDASAIDFDQSTAIRDAVDYWWENGACVECFAEDLSYFFIPRAILPNKPMSNGETRRVYPEVASNGSTWTFGIYGSSIINLGYLAFIFIPAFYLMYTYLYFKSILSRQRNFVLFAYLYFSANAIQFVRGGVLDVRLMRLLLTLFIVYVIYTVLLRFQKKIVIRHA